MTSTASVAVSVLLGLPVIFSAYVWLNDKKLHSEPTEALPYTSPRWSEKDISSAAARKSINVIDHLPPKTGRRYIVVGGAGFVGGWIVIHLLQRGENPSNIRIIDIRPTVRADLLKALEQGVQFFPCDISDPQAVNTAFSQPWPESVDVSSEITIFHSAAVIRFYERHPSLLPLSTTINVLGTRNVIDAARAIGATALVATSSDSVLVRKSPFFLWPWERRPKYYVQIMRDDDYQGIHPKAFDEFISNYSYSKWEAEKITRDADGSQTGVSSKVLRTGCLRPGNAIYGPGGDTLTGPLLGRDTTPTWLHDVIQNHIYVENCSYAHLCYERKLIDLAPGEKGVGGDGFLISDPGPLPRYGDIYTLVALSMSKKRTLKFPPVSPTFMFALAHIFEAIYLTRHFLLQLLPFKSLARLVPPLPADMQMLQPSMFATTVMHIVVDDSRARKELNYAAPWDALSGVTRTMQLRHELEDAESKK